MPKTKKTTTVEETVDETPEEINYTEDLKDKSMEQIAAEPEKVEEPVEEVKEEAPVESETEEIEFDPQALKEEAVVEAEKRLLDKLKGSDAKETKENVDEYQQWAEGFSQSHGGKAPEWKDAFSWMEERAITRLEDRQAKKAQEQLTQQEEASKAEATQMDTVNKYVDEQLNDLYTSGKFPRIQNAEDPNDVGTINRKALFEQTMKINKERLDKGLPSKTIKEVFYEDFKAPNQQPAGANAPISAGRGSAVQGDSEEIDYIKDVRGARSFMDILTRRG